MENSITDLASSSSEPSLFYEILRDFGPVGIAAIALLIAAIGLSTWRRQLRDKISVERAVSFLDSAHDYAQSIARMMSLTDSFRSNKLHLVGPDTRQGEQSLWHSAMQDVMDRQQAMQDAQTKLHSEWGRVQVWWGNGVLEEEMGGLARITIPAMEESARGLTERDVSYVFPYADNEALNQWWSQIYRVIESMRKGLGKELAWYLVRR